MLNNYLHLCSYIPTSDTFYHASLPFALIQFLIDISEAHAVTIQSRATMSIYVEA